MLVNSPYTLIGFVGFENSVWVVQNKLVSEKIVQSLIHEKRLVPRSHNYFSGGFVDDDFYFGVS